MIEKVIEITIKSQNRAKPLKMLSILCTSDLFECSSCEDKVSETTGHRNPIVESLERVQLVECG